MAAFWEMAAFLIYHMLSCIMTFVILAISRFGFWGWIKVLIVSGPDLCILLTFNRYNVQR